MSICVLAPAIPTRSTAERLLAERPATHTAHVDPGSLDTAGRNRHRAQAWVVGVRCHDGVAVSWCERNRGETVDEKDVPDLTGAEVYVEADERSITGGGRWYVLPGDRVIYRRPNGQLELNPIIGSAETLRSSATWKRLPSDDAGTA